MRKKPPISSKLQQAGVAQGEQKSSDRPQLDEIDRKILIELQKNGRIANNELANRVGLSPPPCLHRVRALQTEGFIKGFRARLNERLLGYEIVSFVTIQLESQAEGILAAFENEIRSHEFVCECWLLSGEVDYMMKCVAPSLPVFQSLLHMLAGLPNVRNVKSLLTLRLIKDGPLPVLQA